MKRIFSVLAVGLLIATACNPQEAEPARTHETFTVKPAEVSVEEGESFKLTVTSKPVYDDLEITFETSNKAVATVNDKGVVNAVAEGEATITVKNNIDDKVAECKVTVMKKVELLGITIEPAEVSVAIGATVKLNMTPNPVIPDLEYTWASSNTDVVTVDAEGNITGVAEGEATVTVTNALFGKSATCKVTVTILLFSGGKGTSSDPYQIKTLDDLRLFVEYSSGDEGVSKYSFDTSCYIVTDNIEYPAGDTTSFFKPAFAKPDYPFRGTFDGNNKVISNLMIGDRFDKENVPSEEDMKFNEISIATGIIGFSNGATVKNVILENPHVESNFSCVGAIVGYAENTSISSCEVRGGVPSSVIEGDSYVVNGQVTSIDGAYVNSRGCYITEKGSATAPFGADNYEFQYGLTGGIVGFATGTSAISNCKVNAYVNGKNRSTGGIAGGIKDAVTISSCEFAGYVYCSMTFMSGIVGSSMANTISDCVVRAKVWAKYSYIAGIVASITEGSVKNCKVLDSEIQTAINNTSNAIRGGGIVANSYGSKPVEITGCEVRNTLIKSNATCYGGIIGIASNGAKISGCTVEETEVTNGAAAHECAGIAGWIKVSAEISDCNLTKVKVAGKTWCGGVLGYSDAAATETIKITNCHVDGLDLQSSGSNCAGILGGTPQNNKAANIEITGCSVKNSSIVCTASGAYYGGIDGGIWNGGTITGCTVENTLVQNGGNFVGGIIPYLAGANPLVIDNCKVINSQIVGCGQSSGGIIGRFDINTSITNCYVSGTVSGLSGKTVYNIGGIVGCINAPASATGAFARIDNCAVEADITGTYAIGGIAGGSMSPAGAPCSFVLSNISYKGNLSATGAHGTYPNALIGGIIGYANSTANGCPLYAVNLYARPTTINFTSAVPAESGAIGGLYGYAQNNINTAVGYSDLTKDKIFKDGVAIDETQARIGGIAGVTCYNALGTNGTFLYQGLFYNESIGFGPTNNGSGAPDEVDCAAFPTSAFTDGTLLKYLNAGATQANSNELVNSLGIKASSWVAGEGGYPIIEGLPTAK